MQGMRDALVLVVLLLAFITLSSHYFGFTLDDAYIAFRYSENLAEGYGPVWNVGEDPVEGYTSFLWMLLMALVIRLGKDPVLASKLVSIGAALLSIAIVYHCGRRKRAIAVVAASGMALNPAFALLTVQGMETTLTALWVLCACMLCILLLERYTTMRGALFATTLLLAFLTRPDTLVFAVVLAPGALLITRRKELAIVLLVLFVLPVLVYMVWRTGYYGYLLPNTFYIKEGGGLFSLAGTMMVIGYLALMLAPYLSLMLVGDRPSKLPKGVALVFIALSLFLSIYCFIEPVQGFLFRFEMPTFPTFLALLALCVQEPPLPNPARRIMSKGVLVLILCTLLVIYPLHTLPKADYEMQKRTQFDRVVMGKALSALSDEGYTMFVTESGALPYYSRWRAVDYLGLNSEYIAHHGLDESYLEKLRPDLVMIITRTHEPIYPRYPVLYAYMTKNDYIAVAAVKKTSEELHLYFVSPSSARTIAPHILNIPHLEYVELEPYVVGMPTWRD